MVMLLQMLGGMMGGEVDADTREMVMHLTPNEVRAEVAGSSDETFMDRFFNNAT
jgi:hypothetical protein